MVGGEPVRGRNGGEASVLGWVVLPSEDLVKTLAFTRVRWAGAAQRSKERSENWFGVRQEQGSHEQSWKSGCCSRLGMQTQTGSPSMVLKRESGRQRRGLGLSD